MPGVKTGVFGKLPAHGDFVLRDLPQTFASVWDEWLQHYMSASKEHLGEEWLNVYLTSPIWRFVFNPGVIDQHFWAGIMLPSVDRVGRYYPVSIIRQLDDSSNPLEFMNLQTGWFSAIEDLALGALENESDVDELVASLNDIEVGFNTTYIKNNTADFLEEKCSQVNMEFEEQLPVSVYPYLFDELLNNTFLSYSVWMTTGSELVEPCVFISQSLPPVGKLAAMMDGQWEIRGWPQPCKIAEVVSCQEVMND